LDWSSSFGPIFGTGAYLNTESFELPIGCMLC
jgi:hypothetical protein